MKARESAIVTSIPRKVKDETKKNVVDQRVLSNSRNQSVVRTEAKERLPPKSQRGSRMNHVCHYYRLQGHTRPNCHKLRALNNPRDQRSRGSRDDRRNWTVGQPRSQNEDSSVMDVMKMIEAFTTCLVNFNSRFEGHNSHT